WIVETGTGTLVLKTANSFTGGITIDAGTLELGVAGAAGSGPIIFGKTPDLAVQFGTTAVPTNVIENIGPGDTVEVTNFAATGSHYVGSKLTLDGTGGPLTIDIPSPVALTVSTSGPNTLITIPEPPNTGTVTTIAQLNDAILAADELVSGSYTITLGNNITLGSTALVAINLAPGVTLDINGGTHDLVGGGVTTPQRGLFVYAGDVFVQNLTLDAFDAKGGAGGTGAGGGAGLGGGLFISSNVAGDPGNVTLDNVAFIADRATGGAGGAKGGNGGGGGLGGAGANGSGTSFDDGGGGGVGGAGGSGSTTAPAGGSPGIIPGTAGGAAAAMAALQAVVMAAAAAAAAPPTAAPRKAAAAGSAAAAVDSRPGALAAAAVGASKAATVASAAAEGAAAPAVSAAAGAPASSRTVVSVPATATSAVCPPMPAAAAGWARAATSSCSRAH